MPLNRQDRQYWDIPSIPEDRLVLRHYEAMGNAIRNLFRTSLGDRGGLFRPNWGTYLHQWLQDPLDELSKRSILAVVRYDLNRHFPLVRVNTELSTVDNLPEHDGPGVAIHLAIDTTLYDRGGVSQIIPINIRR